MLKFFHVYKRYPFNISALDDVTCNIEEGEFVFLTGASGAGKTTFLRLIIKEENLTAGNILVNNKNISRLRGNDVAMLRRRIGFVFQDFQLVNHWTIWENVEFPLRILGIARYKRKEQVADVLELVNMLQYRDHYPKQVSGGEQQRVAVARAIINKPAILLADEPTGNLDPDASIHIINIFKKVNQSGTTVVIATHDSHLMRAFESRIIKLDKGHITDD